jgi:hypothetical protein
LFRENHSAGGLIQTPDGGKVSLIQNLYISNKTRNPKVKGVNEFVNNVVYDWGNGNRLDQDFNYGWAGDAYIMGGSAGVSEVNIINNYFVGGPLTPPSKTTPFSRGTGTFNVYGSGNYFDNNKNGILDGAPVPFDTVGYAGISGDAFRHQAYAYPAANTTMTAEQSYQHVIDSVGAFYPRRDQVDGLMIDEVKSKGTKGLYAYRETDLPFSNGGLGDVFSAPAPVDTDGDGMPDAWEDANGLNKNNKADAVAFSASYPQYLNIEVYINSLVSTPPPVFIKSPTAVTLAATSQELPSPNSTVNISWVDNSDNETNFVLERGTDGVNFTDINHPAANATVYVDNGGLVPNATYYYRIKSVNGTDQSSYSTIVSIKTPPIASAPSVTSSPNPANGFQYAALTSGSIALKWSGSTNTVTYSVYLGTDAANLVKKADVAYSTAPTYTATGLANNTTYYWRVDAVNSKGLAQGVVWSFRTPPIIPQGLVGYWAFDEPLDAQTTQVTDSTSYANTGIIGLDADNQGIRIPGKLKNGLDFATADPSIYVVKLPNQDQLYLDKSSFSISFWMKAPATLLPQDNNTSAYLLCKGSITKNNTTGALGRRFDIEFKNKQIRFAIDDDNDANGGGKDELAASGTPFFTNNWVHVVAIRDVTAKKLLLYMNGALVTSVAITKANAGIGEASALVLGNIGELEFLAATNKPAPYKGMLDEVRLYNYVLTTPEITALASVKNTQTIAFDTIAAKKVGDADFGAHAIASSGLPVSLSSSNTAIATVVNGQIHVVAAGTATITATQAGNANYYAAAAKSQVLSVTKYDQSITFGALPAKTIGDADFDASATASSGLGVVYNSSDSTVATVVNGLIHIVGAGSATITATQTGNATFSAASPVSQDLTVIKKSQTITFNALATKTVGDADFDALATASSGLSVVYSSSDSTVGTIVNGLIHIVGAGSATITATQTGDATFSAANPVSQDLTVIKKSQTITFNTLATKTVGDADFDASATASSGLGVVYSSSDSTVATVVNGLIHIVGAGNATITATQTGDASFSAASPVSQDLTVIKKTQTITFNTITTKTVGDADFDASATASSGLGVVYSSSDSTVATVVNGLIHIVGAGNATITATQTGNAICSAASPVSLDLTVIKKTQTITFNALAAKIIGDADFQITATAGSGLPVAFSSSNLQVASVSNGTVHITGAGTATITATQAGDATFYAASTTQVLTVKGLNLQVLAQDGDNGKVNDNSIKPNIKIVNNDQVAVAYNQLTARYWFTAENFAGINTWIDYAQLGSSQVSMKYVALAQPLNGALGYIEYSFNAATSLLPGTNSGPIQSRLSNKDYGVFNETDDYSYQNGNAYAANSHITLYRNGSLVWGTEPTAAAPIVKLKVLTANSNNRTDGNSISTTLVINNEGNMPVTYNDLAVRYWFTSDGAAPLNYWIDYAKLGVANFAAQFIKTAPALSGGDTYFELKPNAALGTFYPLSTTGNIQYRIAKNNWSAFNEADDHSYMPKGPLAENSHVTVYYKGQLIYGTEPAAAVINSFASRIAATPGNDIEDTQLSGVETVVYPNPTADKLYIKLNRKLEYGALVKLFGPNGQLLSTSKLNTTEAILSLGNLAAGMYMIQVENGVTVDRKKVIKN